MNVLRVTRSGVFVGDRCEQCHRTVKSGDVIAWCRTGNFTKPRFVLHVACMSRLVEKAPADTQVGAAVDDLRRMQEQLAGD